MKELRSLTDTGRRTAADILARIRSGESTAVDMRELEDSRLSRPLGVTYISPNGASLSTRWHLGGWLIKTFGATGDMVNTGAWSWLALDLFDLLCPSVAGSRRVREDARYLLEADDYRKAYRHLLAGPYLLMQAHRGDPDAVRGLLATAPDAPGEVYEQLAARKYTVTSRAVVQAATFLYFDLNTGKLKRGAGGSAAGSPRRLSEVLQQFDLTYDLQAIPANHLLNILPKEFARFLKA